jgi:hypothetical protein
MKSEENLVGLVEVGKVLFLALLSGCLNIYGIPWGGVVSSIFIS